MKLGYIIASNEVIGSGKCIGYLYREEPDNDDDSGWRMFSGEETQEYADDSRNFSKYNASTIVKLHPDVRELLGEDFPVEFERDEITGQFIKLEDDNK